MQFDFFITDLKAYLAIILILALLSTQSCRQQQQQAPQPEPVEAAPVKTAEQIRLEQERKREKLATAYHIGYDEGYRTSYRTHKREILDSNPDQYQDPDMRRRYMDGYRKGMEAGYQAYLHYMDSITKARPVIPEKSNLPRGYQDGYEDGYDDGTENDYKDSWNPKSRNAEYLVNYNEGYNEGFEYGRLEYWEDYVLEGVDEDWW